MRIKFLAALMIFVSVGAFAQEDMTRTFGAFKVECKTDRMTDVRSCQLRLSPDPNFIVEQGLSAFLVFIDPKEKKVDSAGFARRLRVDKNPMIAGDCLAIRSGICMFKDKAQSAAFVKQLETGTTLFVEVSDRILEFSLDEYRQALAVYKEATAPVSSQAPATPPTN